MKKLFKKAYYLLGSLLGSLILFFILGAKGFLLYLIIQFSLNFTIFSFLKEETRDNRLMGVCFDLVISFIEFMLMRELAEWNFINIFIFLILFSLVYFVYWNNKSYFYIIRQKPVQNIMFDVVTSVIFFVIVSISIPNILISTVNNNALIYIKNIPERWIFALGIIASLLIYLILQHFLRKGWEFVLGNLISFFLLVYILLLIADLFSTRNYIFGLVESVTIYLFLLPVRLCITDKMKMSEDDKSTFVFSVLLILFYFIPVFLILLRDYSAQSSKQANGVMGLTLLIWGIPKIFTFLQDKIYSYLEYERKEGIKIDRSKDAIISMINIYVFIALLGLNFNYPNKLNLSSKYGDVASNVIFSLSVGILGTFFVIAITYFFTLLFASYKKKCIVFIMYICSFLIVNFSLILINYFSKDFSKEKDILDLMKWSLLLFVPTIFKKMPVILDFVNRSKFPQVLEGRLYRHFCNVTEINLFITVLILYFILYFQLPLDINNIFYLFLIVLVVYLLVHFLIFKFLAEKLQVSSRDS